MSSVILQVAANRSHADKLSEEVHGLKEQIAILSGHTAAVLGAPKKDAQGVAMRSPSLTDLAAQNTQQVKLIETVASQTKREGTWTKVWGTLFAIILVAWEVYKSLHGHK